MFLLLEKKLIWTKLSYNLWKIKKWSKSTNKTIVLPRVDLEICQYIFWTSKLFKCFTNVIMLDNFFFFIRISFKWKSYGTKIKRFHSRTSVKMWQIPQKLLNDQFTNAMTQKLRKVKIAKNYTDFARIKNKIIKTQYHSLYTLSKEWLGDILWKIKLDSLKKTKLNLSYCCK